MWSGYEGSFQDDAAPMWSCAGTPWEVPSPRTYALKYPDELKGIVLVGTGARLRVAPDYLKASEDGIADPAPVAGSSQGELQEHRAGSP